MKFALGIICSILSLYSLASYSELVTNETIISMIPTDGKLGNCSIKAKMINEKQLSVTLSNGKTTLTSSTYGKEIPKGLSNEPQRMESYGIGWIGFHELVEEGTFTHLRKDTFLNYDIARPKFNKGFIKLIRVGATSTVLNSIKCGDIE